MVPIRQNLVKGNMYSMKCPYAMSASYIVVHNTYNDASAKNEISYMRSNVNQVSFHYAVDDQEIIQGIDEGRNAWHASDEAYGEGNRKGIAIEICYSKSGGAKFDKAEVNGAEFIAFKLKEKGWGINKVKRHYDFATDKKYCPHRTMDLGWDRFLNMIATFMEKPKPSTGGMEAFTGFVEVLYNGSEGLELHSKPTFDGYVAKKGKKGDVYTIVGRIKVNGAYMYKLKDGNYITAASQYVSQRKTLHASAPTPSTPKPTGVKYPVGSKATFTGLWSESNGGKWYSKSQLAIKQGVVTKVVSGAAHPYLINNGDGWANDKCIDDEPSMPK